MIMKSNVSSHKQNVCCNPQIQAVVVWALGSTLCAAEMNWKNLLLQLFGEKSLHMIIPHGFICTNCSSNFRLFETNHTSP